MLHWIALGFVILMDHVCQPDISMEKKKLYDWHPRVNVDTGNRLQLNALEKY